MDNREMYAIVPVNGKPPRDAIVWGSISEVMEYVGPTKARANHFVERPEVRVRGHERGRW
jgi:hypothetical protein